MKRLLTNLLIIFSISLSVSAENVPNNHITRHIGIEDGLSNNFILSLDTDKYGFIWIGTEEGMNRFDGIAVKKYTKYSGAIPGNALNKVISDRYYNKVWIATQRSGLASYDYSTGESFFLVHNDNDTTGITLPSNEITCTYQDNSGNIWFSTYTEGLGKYNITSGKITLYNSSNVKGMPGKIIRCFVIGQDNKIYTAYYGSGIAIIDTESMTAETFVNIPGNPSSLPSNEIGSIYRDKDNNIWVGTRKGLALYRTITKDFTVFDSNNSGIPDGIIFSILVTSDNRLLASPDYNGVWEMNLNNMASQPSFTPLPNTDEIRNIGTHAMIEDKFGNIWLGTYGNGLLIITHNTSHFIRKSYPDDLSERSVTGISFTRDDKMVVATDGGGINILDKTLNNFSHSEIHPTDKSILSTICDSDGNIWVGSFNGQTAVLDNSLKLRTVIDIREVRSFFEHGDTMWVASGLSGLYAVDRKNFTIIKRYHKSSHFPDNYIRTVCMDKSERLWVGTFRSGLYIFDKQMNVISEYNTDTGFPSNSIRHLELDSKGNMWVGTGEGLARFNATDSIYVETIITGKHGLSSESIGGIVEDNDHSIWFSTNLSICHIDPLDDIITEYRYQSGISNGNYAPGAVSSRDNGMICFGSTKGITCFFPDSLNDTNSDIPIHFSEMHIFDENDPISGESRTISLAGETNINLNYKQCGFNITFAADDYGISNNVSYSYKVLGKDNKWYILPSGNNISFHKLEPGKYDLCIRARINDEAWSENTANLRIIIRPPFYASIPAYIIYTIIVLTIAVILISLYSAKLAKENELKLEKASIAKIKEINEERLRFYTNITHELKTPLTLILGPTEDLLNEESMPDQTRNRISVVHKNASRLLELINQLLNFRKTETNNVVLNPAYGNLSKFTEDVCSIFSESNQNRHTLIKTDISNDIMAIFDHEIMTTVLNNLLSNAMKYTPSGCVTVGLKTDDSTENRIAIITVADTGLGIDKDQYDKIFDRFYQVPGRDQSQGTGIGLSIVKNLVAVHHGSINVSSEKGKGSIFTVQIPIDDLQDNTKDIASDKEVVNDNSRPIIVVAEDNEDIRNYIKDSLSETYEVHTAKNGLEGYSKSCRYIPDIIISDIMMPIMDGWKLCEKVKQDIKLSHIPVIFLTAKDTINDRMEGYKVGADSFISKPFTSEMLNARIKNLIDSRKKIARQFTNSPSVQDEEINKQLFSEVDNEFLTKISNYIEENISSEELTIDYLAEKMNMSSSSLYRKLKGLLGLSAIELIRKVKMKKAAEMLASGNHNISETAWNVGISSMIYFRQCFKDEFGMSPSEYKKKYTKTVDFKVEG